MARTRPTICVVGSTNIDLVTRVPHLPRLGETIVGHSFHMGHGGKGANQAVMAAKLGAQVTMVTKLGRDVFGEGSLGNYHQQGVERSEERRVGKGWRTECVGWEIEETR